ncbi:MAG: hypothetical protein E2P02_28500, partial [Acidobacteria bacterium]
MKFWTRYSTIALIVVIGALLPVLAALQYHWLGEISRFEQQHMRADLRSAARRFSIDFDAELANLYQALHVKTTKLEDVAGSIASDYQTWAQAFPYPELVKAVYWVEVFAETKPTIRQVDLDAGVFREVDWPAELEPVRDVFLVPGSVNPLQAVVSALVVPQHGTEPVPWAVVMLDLDVIAGPFLTDRVSFFAGDTPIDFEAIVVGYHALDKVFHASDPRLSAEELIAHEGIDESMPFFGLHTRDFRTDWIEALPTAATEHHLRLYIRHKPGALAAAVGVMRARNLAVSFGSLMLLAGSILVLVLTTRRSQRWARLQLEYVARIAHELRTPLAVIGVASENLADSVVSDLPTARKYGEMINKESRRLSKVVESALLHSKFESGAAKDLERQPVRIAEIIEAALGETDVSGAAVVKHVADELPDVMGDGAALKSALQNLFANAVKHSSKPASISVSVKAAEGLDGSAIEIAIE